MGFAYEKDIALVKKLGIYLSSIGVFILCLGIAFRQNGFWIYIGIFGLFYLATGFLVGLFLLYKLIFIFLQTRPRFESKNQRNAFFISLIFLLANLPLSFFCLVAGAMLFDYPY